jgi:hypothetical protein
MKFSGPKILLHLEGLAVLIIACALYRKVGASWITFAVLFLAPDISMFGYLFGKKFGACAYNTVHTYITPFLLFLIAYFSDRSSLFPICLIWVAHIGFDRLLGYGMKYDADFKDTHLNRV